ncbi:tRNA dimethylallyltransferase [Prevotella sp. tc2-28]|uniref:tRNA (adenosine(37)-N6)-dimethylallyltransferase MiaA n=1 Tax=Prevotella sp. tc2-28 TaxID=1761888 RepID=UPI0008975FB8|nr:tRNA (adenosine(37)-N6)-dimethylallyltransferase MiaA [Prevotella sp. tc2-28]SEA92881.1 tRNA dimethylallyltransferase [Prevotella sp. tc2-28]
MNTLIAVTGPTAVGKTALTIEIAKHYGIPIINADSRQIYQELKIGTASPTAEQMQQVKHYFVGTKSITDYYNASMYEQEVVQLLEKLFVDSPVQLLSGGSMMYIDAVCNGIDDIPTVRDDIRNEMKRRYQEEGLDALCEDLRRLDPEHYEVVDRQNHRRVIHALEICYQTGKTYTSFRTQKRKERPFQIVKIGLTRDRQELYDRINQRVDTMMSEGLLDEVRSVSAYRSTNALNTVGYKELFDYIDGRWPLEEAVERIKGNTRRYARKQLTWYKRDEQVTWFHPDQQDKILKFISHYE